MKRDEINIYKFAKESNEIECIYADDKHDQHYLALASFLELKKITICDLEDFVNLIEVGAFLRTERYHKVKIGGRLAPSPALSLPMLKNLLEKINCDLSYSIWEAHAEYEFIHPFIDGNGRSGRALWLWMMTRKHGKSYSHSFSFLQWYYYQTLSRYSENRK